MKCDQCGKTHNRKRFCSNKCKDRWHNLNKEKIHKNEDDDESSDIEAMAGSDYAADWGEDGWRN